MQAIYVSSNQFKVSTDKTSEFLAGRRVRALCGSEYKYSTVYSSTYSSPDTTVTLEEGELTSNLSEVHYGIVNIGEQGSFPKHSHDGNEGTGGVLSLLNLEDTPSSYEEGKYLRATTSGVVFEDLDDYYYTESEVDTISGSLQSNIDSMPSAFLDLADTPTTYSGVSGKYLKTTSSGIIFSDIDSEYWESVDVFLDENYSNDKGLPTQVERGLFKGYSMPIWVTPANQYEELVFRIRVPFRWDGTTNPTFMILVSISATEDIGDKFKFQMEWESKGVSGVIPDTTAETLTDEVTVTDGTAYYSYLASASLDATKLISGDNLQFRVRRVAATDPQVSNEIIIWHWDSRWKMNKLGTVSE